MKIDISKKELQNIRDIIHKGRENYRLDQRRLNVFDIGTKLIRKINNELKKVNGHTCNGEFYIS